MIYRACHHAGKWTLDRSRKVGRSEEEVWEPLEFGREEWVTLRELLWRKYQRKRCPWKLIEQIDKLLEDEFPVTADGEKEASVEEDEW